MTIAIHYLRLFLHLPSGERRAIGYLSQFGDVHRVSFDDAYVDDFAPQQACNRCTPRAFRHPYLLFGLSQSCSYIEAYPVIGYCAQFGEDLPRFLDWALVTKRYSSYF